jgi:CheY-like chemotaxis protein
MDGAAAIRALRAMDPGVRVVAVSGLPPGHAAPAAAPRDGRIRHLAKPYTARELLRAIDVALRE